MSVGKLEKLGKTHNSTHLRLIVPQNLVEI